MAGTRHAMRTRVVVLLLVVVRAGVLPAREPVQPPQFRGATTAVVIDVVVRDRGGRPVTDLTKADFELTDEGVRQEIADLALVMPPRADAAAAGAPSGGPAADAAPNQSTPVNRPSFVAIVFDRLSPEGRASAVKGARVAQVAS